MKKRVVVLRIEVPKDQTQSLMEILSQEVQVIRKVIDVHNYELWTADPISGVREECTRALKRRKQRQK